MADHIEQQSIDPVEFKSPKRGIARRTMLIWLAVIASAEVVASGITWQTFLQGIQALFGQYPDLTHPLTLGYRFNPVYSVAWAADGKRLASGSYDGTVLVRDASSGKTLLTYSGHSAPVYSVAWAADGKRLASGSYDKTVRVWDASSGKTLLTYTRHSNSVTSVAWAADGKLIASGSDDSMVQVWDASSGKTLFTY
jgi:WD40 repeat protein